MPSPEHLAHGLVASLLNERTWDHQPLDVLKSLLFRERPGIQETLGSLLGDHAERRNADHPRGNLYLLGISQAPPLSFHPIAALLGSSCPSSAPSVVQRTVRHRGREANSAVCNPPA